MSNNTEVIKQLKQIIKTLQQADHSEAVNAIEKELDELISLDPDDLKAQSLCNISILKKILIVLTHPKFGLKEIKQEIKDIEAKLDDPQTGLAEIKQEIKDIEAKLDDPQTGLAEIKQEIQDIEAKLDDPQTGLAEIKQEIKDIEAKLDQIVPGACNTLTTGPVVADNGVNSVVVKVLNNTSVTRSITVTIFNIGTCPNPKTVVQSRILTVQAKCAEDFIFDRPPTEFEVTYSNVVPGIFVFTAGRSNAANAPLSASNLNPANTFRHAEHVCSLDP